MMKIEGKRGLFGRMKATGPVRFWDFEAEERPRRRGVGREVRQRHEFVLEKESTASWETGFIERRKGGWFCKRSPVLMCVCKSGFSSVFVIYLI